MAKATTKKKSAPKSKKPDTKKKKKPAPKKEKEFKGRTMIAKNGK